MKTPKILPWLARRSGISDHRAQQLWGEALRHATRTTEWVGTPEFWTAAMNKLQELIEAEFPGDTVCLHQADSSAAHAGNSANTHEVEDVLPEGLIGRLCFH